MLLVPSFSYEKASGQRQKSPFHHHPAARVHPSPIDPMANSPSLYLTLHLPRGTEALECSPHYSPSPKGSSGWSLYSGLGPMPGDDSNQVPLSLLCPQPHPSPSSFNQRKQRRRQETRLRQPQKGETAAITGHCSGLMGEAEQEGGGKKQESGPGREAERDTLDHRPRGQDRQRPARAVGALGAHRAFWFLGS